MNMEAQQQQEAASDHHGENSSSAKGGHVCRQSSTRWTPTSDQIRILRDLYYNCGVRSPNAEQIQRISARLRQYGKIEGKNVFYWFQNHKARERQKKRFTTTIATDDHLHLPIQPPTTALLPFPTDNISPAAGFSSVGQIGNYGYGSVTMEKSFRNCSISTSNNYGVGGSMSSSNGWIGNVDAYSSSYSFIGKQKSINEILEDEEQEEYDVDDDDDEKSAELETLPLFPTQREDINGFCNIKHNPICYTYNWYGTDDANTTSPTSLELSLNSFSTPAPDSI